MYALTGLRQRPYFAELPYYVWGRVNYDSDGDCRRPSDRSWTSLELTHRESRATVRVYVDHDTCTIEGSTRDCSRAARYLVATCGASPVAGTRLEEGAGGHAEAMKRARAVHSAFEDARLAPFDDHSFWNCWKWIGGFSADFANDGILIMDAVRTGDTRAVGLCADWLREHPATGRQADALCYALRVLTGKTFTARWMWLHWYFGLVPFRRGPGQRRYPPPDVDRWLSEFSD